MRMQEDYTVSGDVDVNNVYGGAPKSDRGFIRFLRKAEKRLGVLPHWWKAGKKSWCLKGRQERPIR
jgi:hypothetical protein